MTTSQEDPVDITTTNTKMATIKEEQTSTETTTMTSKQSSFTFSNDIPIFLKKTWAMIDSCTQPDICGWYEDDNGESFVVKDPKRFESEIIPQFFKHSKFTSFVRQLNFYSFRKIKFGDGIRVDAEEENKNKNFWRFYHEKFRKGHPEWLIHVKRTVHGSRSSAGSTSHASGGRAAGASTSASSSSSSSMKNAVVENQQLKTEVSSLKERIDAMTKNIDQLTTMVQQVTLKQTKDNDNDTDSQCSDDSSLHHRRRPRKVVVLNEQASLSATAYVGKVADTITSSSSPASPLKSSHSVADDVAMPDISDSVTSMGNVHSFMPVPPSSPGLPSPAKFDDGSTYYGGTTDGGRATSDSELSDQGFVDQLLTAFKEEDTSSIDVVDRELLDVAFDVNDADFATGTSSTPQGKEGGRRNTAVSPVSSPAFNAVSDDDNRPREELMRRLSDALSLLPRNVQELIVDRLIHAITSPQEIQDSLKVARALEEVITATTSPSLFPSESLCPTEVPHTDDEHDVAMEDSGASVADDEETQVEAPAAPTNTPTATPPPSLPLAAATLAALLSQYNQKQAAAAAASSASNNDVDGHHHHGDDEHHHEVSEAQRKSKRIAAKSLLIPVHA